MSVSLTSFTRWLWGGKTKDPAQNGSTIYSTTRDLGLGFREVDNVKFPSEKGAEIASSSTRKVRRKWKSREEGSVDTESDVVLVPSDGVCLSGSESDDSDWSIGWLEPHAPEFQSDDEGSFAVLVPCYRNDCKEFDGGPNSQFLSAIKNLPDDFADGKTYVEQWLSSLQHS